ncbi:uncharacterized protein ACBR49_015041 [Aulostomus maculatus]
MHGAAGGLALPVAPRDTRPCPSHSSSHLYLHNGDFMGFSTSVRCVYESKQDEMPVKRDASKNRVSLLSKVLHCSSGASLPLALWPLARPVAARSPCGRSLALWPLARPRSPCGRSLALARPVAARSPCGRSLALWPLARPRSPCGRSLALARPVAARSPCGRSLALWPLLSLLMGVMKISSQYLPFQWPLLDVPGRAAIRESATTQAHLPNSVPMVQHPHMTHLHPLLSYSPEAFSPQRASPGFSPDTAGMSRPPHTACYPVSPGGVAQLPHPLGWLQSQPMYPITGGFSPAALAMNASMSSLVSSSFSPRLVPASQASIPHPAIVPSGIKQEPRSSSPPGRSMADGAQQEKDEERKPHIKKPLNAFMLYMREERPKVVAQCKVKESATINQILGQRWHSLSKDEQAKYYELARKERLLHSKLYPGWSARDNYGKKKKRKRAKSESQHDASVQDFSPQSKRPLMSPGPEQTPHTHVPLTHSQTTHTRPHLSQPHTISHLTHTHLSQASPASSLDSPATPTTALASPGAPAPTHTEHTHSYSGHTSPYGEQLQPLSLTTKPHRTALPPSHSAAGPSTPSSDTPTPSPHTASTKSTPPPPPPPLPFLAPPSSSSHQSAARSFSRRASQL